MKALKITSGVVNILILILYFLLIYAVTAMFGIFPWYDADHGYLILMLMVWIPLCVLTLIHITLALLTKRFYKPIIALEAVNALYIPLLFVLGADGSSLTTVRTLGIFSLITIIMYIVLSIYRARKER